MGLSRSKINKKVKKKLRYKKQIKSKTLYILGFRELFWKFRVEKAIRHYVFQDGVPRLWCK